MRIFFTIITILILMSGCSTRNAFSKLGLTQEQENALEKTKNGQLVLEDKVGGVFSVVYLNNIYTESDKNTARFYLSVYLKEQSEHLKVTMNDKKPLKTEKLGHENEFAHLLPKKSQWSKNYLVTFNNTENNNTINLLIESDQFSSGQLSYLKDEQ